VSLLTRLLATLATRTSPLAVALITAVSLLCVAAPAGAVVTLVGPTTVGLQPRDNEYWNSGTLRSNELGEANFEHLSAQSFENAGGNAVMHEANTYVVYWDPTPRGYHGDWREVIDRFMHGAGESFGGLFSVNGQYTDRTNKPAATRPTFKVSYDDTEAYPSAGCTDPHPLTVYKPFQTGPIVCLTDLQIQQHLQSFITQHGLPTGMGTIYTVLTPPGVTACLDAGGPTGHCSDFEATKLEEESEKFVTESYKHSFCSYHSDINPVNPLTGAPNTVLYAVVPWTAGLQADGQYAPVDERSGLSCQDGGFNPASKPAIELKEKVPVQQEPNQPTACPSPDGYCDTGLADLIVNQIAAEQVNTVINPLLNAWQDPARNESTDECRNWFSVALGGSAIPPPEGSGAGTLYNQIYGGRNYYLNTGFNLASIKLNYPGVFCLPGIRLEPHFTAPNTVSTGDIVGFDGMESNITLNANSLFDETGASKPNYATFTWNFGDGSPTVSGFAPGSPPCEAPWLSPCASSAFHSYTYGGTYTVTLTVVDVGGNTASVSNPITVAGSPPPGSPAAGGSGAGGSGATSSAGSGAGSTAGGAQAGSSVKPAVPPPIATAAVVSHSLRRALRGGLVVRYSVNEQVAGHFEVLLGRAIARRLGIGGPQAFGLPAGTPPQVIIGRAVLVTTSAGRSTVNIQFSKRTASRLARLHSVPLMLRLFVRNAASQSPATTTVLSTVTLGH
jgi:hypothetical protein